MRQALLVAPAAERANPPGRSRDPSSSVRLACLAAVVVAGGAAAQGKPDTEPAFVDGQTVQIAAMHLITSPSPEQLADASFLYLAAYPVDAGATGAPVTRPSGYRPNCNPCFHPGLDTAFVYHDHVLSGAPTLGRRPRCGT